VLLEWAALESRILITIDTDFGQLVLLEGQSHSGLIRLPDVSSNERVAIIKDLIERFQKELESHAIITCEVARSEFRHHQSDEERSTPSLPLRVLTSSTRSFSYRTRYWYSSFVSPSLSVLVSFDWPSIDCDARELYSSLEV